MDHNARRYPAQPGNGHGDTGWKLGPPDIAGANGVDSNNAFHSTLNRKSDVRQMAAARGPRRHVDRALTTE